MLFRDSVLTDLNSLIDPSAGWCLQSASAINDLGQIAGSGVDPSGRLHAYLLTPTAGATARCRLVAGLGLPGFGRGSWRRLVG